MPRIDEHPEYRARLGRNVHNLSHPLTITCSTGHLLPVFTDILNPGESVRISAPFELRTQPMMAAAMVDIYCHMEYFFVPMQLLFSAFGNVFYGVNDNFSSHYPVTGVTRSNLPITNIALNYALATAGVTNVNRYTGERRWQTVYRLADLFQFDLRDLWSNPTQAAAASYNPYVFPYQYLAYNAIYQYYYRLDTREKFKNRLFNLDWLYNVNEVSSSLAYDVFDLKCRPIADDYFTSVKVSPIVDALNVQGGIPFGSDQRIDSAWLSRGQISQTTMNDILISGTSGGSRAVTDSPMSGTTSPKNNQASLFSNFGFRFTDSNTSLNGADINTANIRAMFANEKYYSILGRARKNYDDQTLAHFGVSVPKDIKHEISFFGHDVVPIRIGEVISTSGTDSTSLGEIAGKGYAYASKNEHTFRAPVHGVVMCIFSVVPKVRYSRTGCARINWIRNADDFYRPEFDALGMQPMFGQEVGVDYTTDSYKTEIVGWQYRYEQFKRRYPRTTSIFTESYKMRDTPGDVGGNLSSWSVSRLPFNGKYHLDLTPPEPNTESFDGFLHQPDDMDSVMLASYNKSVTIPESFDSDHGDVYMYDPFVVDFNFDIKKMSSMSDYSLPRLD